MLPGVRWGGADGTRGVGLRPAGGAAVQQRHALLLDVEVDPEQDQRPEEDGEDRRQNAAPALDVPEVVMRRRDRHAHSDVDEGENADSTAAAHGEVLARLPVSQTQRETTSQSRATRSITSAATRSRPGPQEMTSRLPSRLDETMSSPGPPKTRSLPRPGSRWSFPPSPKTMSSPTSPEIVSGPPPP